MQIYVSGLAYDTTAQNLDEVFSLYGDVGDIRLVDKPGTNVPSGYGFVAMPNQREALAAIAGLEGAEIGGRTIHVSKARRQ